MKTRELLKEQDRLWSTHYWYTREVIKDYVYNTGCFNTDLNALMENQDNLGNNFANLTGNKRAGPKLTALLKIHINIAVQIVVAASKGQDISVLNAQWMTNATNIAHVYHKYWDRISERKMNNSMQIHLTTTLAEAVAIINKNCEDSYVTGEKALEHINMMADYIGSKF